MKTLLAFDTATERMSIALAAGGEVRVHEAAGGAQASAALIPAIVELLGKAGVALEQVDAIAFGRGPGAFTGLRTACSVAQGLAFGAGKPVLPVDTLLTVAEDARVGEHAQRWWIAMDARMDEIYAAHYAFDHGRWSTLVAPMLVTPDMLNERWRAEPAQAVAGSALAVFGERLRTGGARRNPEAAPHARAMLPLAQRLWEDGGAVDAAQALPLYVRDKVAQTTTERDAARLARQPDMPEGAR
ncbi:tRNA (adenosine(37)-N6)-threonylcarbamoyltransferase complex dimerization subunit type 1 TsaB [Piscinibacter sp. XHJ-5]|uniref:tRNA (adenosine(37)-N6)-threonylcarbamoyltransferase complex dimerization subunit type 1 TsaB n=1 Tax=Piscinibacter sp. XHJ-5 TaxID=3037797 RepID=UPI002452B734|nr:tRNA (adenosine(37)-N6)-threonylcarbamoyltransferase complex dimerization subunit type 1 TsaB [Piscinibacter sp. XHJ-5]